MTRRAKNPQNQFAKSIKKYLIDQDMTQTDLAILTNVSKSEVSEMFRGVRKISTKFLDGCIAVLKLNEDQASDLRVIAETCEVIRKQTKSKVTRLSYLPECLSEEDVALVKQFIKTLSAVTKASNSKKKMFRMEILDVMEDKIYTQELEK